MKHTQGNSLVSLHFDASALSPALATDPMSMEKMHALLTFLLSVPENARMGMAEAAVEVLMDSGLEDSASCLMGNVASAGPQDSSTTEIFYEKSLEIKTNNPVTGNFGQNEEPSRLYYSLASQSSSWRALWGGSFTSGQFA